MKKEMTVLRTGSVPDWEKAGVQPLLPCRWSPNPPPKVTVQALWREDALLIRLCSDAAPTRAVNTAPDSPVWEDSCLECFLSADGRNGLWFDTLYPDYIRAPSGEVTLITITEGEGAVRG